MSVPIRADHGPSIAGFFREVPRWLLTPVPLALLQPILGRIGAHVAKSRPELFARLGRHAGKRFLIDPIDLPFVLLLIPTADEPRLIAYRRYENPQHDAHIGGTFLNLLEMIAGSADGDALFFSRELRISGDVEATVALRNALDDCDGSVIDTVVGAFGPLAGPAAMVVSALRAMRVERRHG
jgi:predicted lipid carrier protein YhbT